MPINNINQLTDKMEENIELINKIGHEMGVSQRVINTAIQVANLESNLGALHENPESTAMGIFQFLKKTDIDPWGDALNRIEKNFNTVKYFLLQKIS